MASTSRSGQGEQGLDPFSALETRKRIIRPPSTAERFDVYINHGGPDTKENLAKPLCDSLQQVGIQAFLDSEETQLGDSISSAIEKAIFSATVHIAIFSPRYVESVWCLNELALMVQTKARIIPLFYHVDPSDFRHIEGGVADAFSKHKEKGRYSGHKIQLWKECLQNVSGITGFELNGQNEDLNKLCNKIVSAVVEEKQKRKVPLPVARYAVGLDELANDFYSHYQRNGEMRDKIIGIYGMGGSGKTTLAKYLFNDKHSEFSGSAILFDVREKYVKGTLISLQKELLKQLFPGDHPSFSSIEDGIAVIIDYFQKNQESRFLIVIDDVDRLEQLDALLPMDALNPNSLVIVTTRDKSLLREAGVGVQYGMKAMNAEHSRQLFCWHAFHRKSCERGFENLVDSFVEACGGLPLSLQVLGGEVFGSGKAYWELKLDAMKANLVTDIQDTLKISYDSLEEDVKQIFMDIACFFIGEDVSRAMSKWKDSGWRAEHALQTLQDKCLVEVDTYGPERILRMHNHLRDLGRAMADNESSHSRRLWRQDPEDLIELSNIKDIKDFRHIKGEVANAFSKHEEKGSYPNHDIQLEKECLQNVSGIRGFELNGQNENDKSTLKAISRYPPSAVIDIPDEEEASRPARGPSSSSDYIRGLADLASTFNWGIVVYILGSYGIILSNPVFWLCWSILVTEAVIYYSIRPYWNWVGNPPLGIDESKEAKKPSPPSEHRIAGAVILKVGMSISLITLLLYSQDIAQRQIKILLFAALSIILIEGLRPILIVREELSNLTTIHSGNFMHMIRHITEDHNWKTANFLTPSVLNAMIGVTGAIVVGGNLGSLMPETPFWIFISIFVVDVLAEVIHRFDCGKRSLSDIPEKELPKISHVAIILRRVVEVCLCYLMTREICQDSYFPSHMDANACNGQCQERSKQLLITMVVLGGFQAAGTVTVVTPLFSCVIGPHYGPSILLSAAVFIAYLLQFFTYKLKKIIYTQNESKTRLPV